MLLFQGIDLGSGVPLAVVLFARVGALQYTSLYLLVGRSECFTYNVVHLAVVKGVSEGRFRTFWVDGHLVTWVDSVIGTVTCIDINLSMLIRASFWGSVCFSGW